MKELGKITFQWQGREMTATLESNGQWKCEDDLVQERLNWLYALDKGWYSSPSSGFRGALAIQDAAKDFKGKSEYLAPYPKSKPGEEIVY